MGQEVYNYDISPGAGSSNTSRPNEEEMNDSKEDPNLWRYARDRKPPLYMNRLLMVRYMEPNVLVCKGEAR